MALGEKMQLAKLWFHQTFQLSSLWTSHHVKLEFGLPVCVCVHTHKDASLSLSHIGIFASLQNQQLSIIGTCHLGPSNRSNFLATPVEADLQQPRENLHILQQEYSLVLGAAAWLTEAGNPGTTQVELERGYKRGSDKLLYEESWKIKIIRKKKNSYAWIPNILGTKIDLSFLFIYFYMTDRQTGRKSKLLFPG